MASIIRWGILGSGLISSDFATAVKGLPANEHEVRQTFCQHQIYYLSGLYFVYHSYYDDFYLSLQIVAVAARQLKSAKSFADKFAIPKAYGKYEELAKDTNVGENI